jgi:hypothetical protein
VRITFLDPPFRMFGQIPACPKLHYSLENDKHGAQALLFDLEVTKDNRT